VGGVSSKTKLYMLSPKTSSNNKAGVTGNLASQEICHPHAISPGNIGLPQDKLECLRRKLLPLLPQLH